MMTDAATTHGEPIRAADLGEQGETDRREPETGAHDVGRAGRGGRSGAPRFEPTMNAIADGSDHSPACERRQADTSCRYWATNRK